MTQYDVIVIGGGAAGMMAAMFAKRQKKNVLLCEKMSKLGKKLLVSGAGRCNLLNEKLDSSFYHPDARNLIKTAFSRFGKERILYFFHELGLQVYSETGGRMFPITNQASSVVKVLETELERLQVPIELHCAVKSVRFASKNFELSLENGKRLSAKTVVLCAGGRSYPALGADGGGYGIAEKFNHTIMEPVPCTVPLLVKDPWCHHLQGQKVRAVASAYVKREKVSAATGDVLFTKYGLSGTAILDISGPVSIAMNREKISAVSVTLDLAPFFSETKLEEELCRRMDRAIPTEKILDGLLPSKLCVAMRDVLNRKDLPSIVRELKHKTFKVDGTRGWNEAEFTAGGIPASEVEISTLESKFQKGLYFAGEIVDVGGLRGGYNLAWAWASGAVAGQTA